MYKDKMISFTKTGDIEPKTDEARVFLKEVVEKLDEITSILNKTIDQ